MTTDIEQQLREMFDADAQSAVGGAPAMSPAPTRPTLTRARLLTAAALVVVIALGVWAVPGLLSRGATPSPVTSPAPVECPQRLSEVTSTTTVQDAMRKGAVTETLVCVYGGPTVQASTQVIQGSARILGDPLGPYFAASNLPGGYCPTDGSTGPGGVPVVLTYSNGAHDTFMIQDTGCGDVVGLPGNASAPIGARTLLQFMLTQTPTNAPPATVMVQALETGTGYRPVPVSGHLALVSGSNRHTLTTDGRGLVVADLPPGTYTVEDLSFETTYSERPSRPISCTAPKTVAITGNNMVLLPVTCPR
jgi:hypothetical protein